MAPPPPRPAPAARRASAPDPLPGRGGRLTGAPLASLTSIRFRRDAPDWCEDSSVSGDSCAGSGSQVETVVGLPVGPGAGSCDGAEIYRVAAKTGESDRPAHWEAAEAEGGRSFVDLLQMMGGGGDDEEDDSDASPSATRAPSDFYDLQRPGLALGHSAWSCVDSQGSAGSSQLWDRMEDCSARSKTTEVSPLTERRRRRQRRRKLFARRCAKFVVAAVALAAAGGSVGYLVLEKRYEPALAFVLENNFLARLTGGGPQGTRGEGAPAPAPATRFLPQALEGARRLPQALEGLLHPPPSQRELERRERDERVLARKRERVLARDRVLEARREQFGHRKTAVQGAAGYYQEQGPQGYPAASPGHLPVEEGWQGAPEYLQYDPQQDYPLVPQDLPSGGGVYQR